MTDFLTGWWSGQVRSECNKLTVPRVPGRGSPPGKHLRSSFAWSNNSFFLQALPIAASRSAGQSHPARRRRSLGSFGTLSRLLALNRYLDRLPQYVVVCNSLFSDQNQKIATCGILHGFLAQRWRVQSHINCVAHFEGNVITRGFRGAISRSPMRLNLCNGCHLILRCALAKSRKRCHTDRNYTH